nr:G protein-coupled receptor [Proales similis]
METAVPNDSSIYNDSSLIPMEPFAPYIYSFTLILTAIFCLSIILNLVAVASIFYSHTFSPIDILVLNLCVADLVYTLGIPLFLSQMFDQNWKYGAIGCKVFIFTDLSGLIVSVLAVTALSVERYVNITDENKRMSFYTNQFNRKPALLFSLVTWLIALLFNMPMIRSIRIVEVHGLYSCQSSWSDMAMRTFFLTKFSLIFMLPLIVILVSSVKLLTFLSTRGQPRRQLTEHINNIRLLDSSDQASALNKSGNQTTAQYLTNHTEASSVYLNKPYLEMSMNSARSSLSQSPVQTDLAALTSQTSENQSDSPKCAFCRNLKSLSSAIIRIFTKCHLPARRLENDRSLMEKHMVKASRLVLAIIILFFLQWLPLWIFQLTVLFTTSFIPNVQLINLTISTLSYSNTLANPVIFIFITHNFKSLLTKLCS